MKKYRFLILIFVLLSVILNVSGQPHGKRHGPPSWAPAHGFREKTRYVYFPEYNVYYDLRAGIYIYYKSNKWITSAEINSDLAGFDFKIATKIELDYTGENPERYNKEHKEKYRKQENNKVEKSNKNKSKTTQTQCYKRR